MEELPSRLAAEAGPWIRFDRLRKVASTLFSLARHDGVLAVELHMWAWSRRHSAADGWQ